MGHQQRGFRLQLDIHVDALQQSMRTT